MICSRCDVQRLPVRIGDKAAPAVGDIASDGKNALAEWFGRVRLSQRRLRSRSVARKRLGQGKYQLENI
jgi:hypothetical protein